MKKNIIYKFLFVICFGALFGNVTAQQVNTLYFMDNVPYRNKLNPAFQPLSNFYFGLTPLGYTQFGFGNNSITLKDLIYKDPTNPTGNPITFLHPNGSIDNFVNAIRTNTLIGGNVDLNLLNFGFRTGKAYWNFSLTERFDAQATLPKSIDNIRNLGVDFTLYTEAGLGYSRQVNDVWSWGSKAKLLLGTANAEITNNLNIDSSNGLVISGVGTGRIATPISLNFSNMSSSTTDMSSKISEFISPTGIGAGIDLGATYKPIPALTLSAAVIDLGMINWTKNTKTYTATVNFDSKNISVPNTTNMDSIMTSVQNSVTNTVKTDSAKSAYSTLTSPKLNVGAEYGFFDNKLTLGVLSRTMLHRSMLFEELTASVNIKPRDWFDLSASYSFMNGRASNIGAGLGLRLGIFHGFVTADYVPFDFARYDQFQYLPYNTKGFNLAFGFSLVIGNRKDADKDGVVDRKDKCPQTPFSVVVDKKGCPLDTDGDGVPDYLDKCAGTPPEAYSKINQDGCPTDADGDGVPDYLDKCPGTPKEAYGHVDKTGCPLDTDGDGIFDYLDKCPGTPLGTKVDSVGCPADTDKDGVPDYIDKCPGTPVEARNMVDSVGCPYDKDKDGVLDYLDLCPNTPAEARAYVDKNGCTLDKDGDGVPDYLDKCPDTPAEAKGSVDQNGCPRDTDGDGIADYLDNCPKIPGVASNHGCPEIKKEVKKLFQKALRGIQFETGKYIIKPVSFKILDDVAAALIGNPTYLVEIQGHTDNMGKPEANMTLSDNRANAVKEYLIKKGVSVERMTSHGYGDTKPVATNKTAAGRALNRRVEFVVTFEETVKE